MREKGDLVAAEAKVRVKNIVEKLTMDTSSIFAEKVYLLAAEFGIGEMLVKESLQELIADNFVTEPMQGILRRVR